MARPTWQLKIENCLLLLLWLLLFLLWDATIELLWKAKRNLFEEKFYWTDVVVVKPKTLAIVERPSHWGIQNKIYLTDKTKNIVAAEVAAGVARVAAAAAAAAADEAEMETSGVAWSISLIRLANKAKVN